MNYIYAIERFGNIIEIYSTKTKAEIALEIMKDKDELNSLGCYIKEYELL